MIEVRLDRARAIPGYMHEEELAWLALNAAGANLIVEAGSYKGRSTRALADHCSGMVIAVDPWDGGYANDDGSQARWLDTRAARAEFHANLKDHIASGRVLMRPLPFREAFARGEHALRPDMVFIDGDHRYEEVFADIELAQEMLAEGGLLCGHDYGHKKWPGVKRAVDEFFGGRVKLCRTIWWVRP